MPSGGCSATPQGNGEQRRGELQQFLYLCDYFRHNHLIFIKFFKKKLCWKFAPLHKIDLLAQSLSQKAQMVKPQSFYLILIFDRKGVMYVGFLD